ncbi:MAG: aldo/keto reductase [Acetobacteraceae bacterium]|nr:aldo/keto reductase [Acetobacteraceae bacterium]MSP30194.1 aldo/keto reductase [Acetobacteraceae bacterium]
MRYTTLGRTGLRVSVAGLGTGGYSRLGLGTGKTEANAIAVVREAHAQGITLFDTGTNYMNEAVLGRALQPIPRDSIVITTKTPIHKADGTLTPERVIAGLDASLRDLRTDYLDVFMLHGVPPAHYQYAHDVILPTVLREKDKGKFRHLGISETAPGDLQHEMLRRATLEGWIDVAMVSFHMMHQSARDKLFPHTMAQKVGTMLMYAVRGIFTSPDRLLTELRAAVAAGQIPVSWYTDTNPLNFLLHPGGAETLVDAAYRFARHEPGVDIVLFGTGNTAHVRDNISSLLGPPLPAADHAELIRLCASLPGLGLDRPAHATPAIR